MTCNSVRQSFVEQCISGDALLDDIDNFVEEWHRSDCDLPIEAFLGMTFEEYASWVEKPKTLRLIIAAHKTNTSFTEFLQQESSYPLAARAASDEEIREVIEWLKKAKRI